MLFFTRALYTGTESARLLGIAVLTMHQYPRTDIPSSLPNRLDSTKGNNLLASPENFATIQLFKSTARNKERKIMQRIVIAALIALLSVPAFAAEEPKVEDQKTMYAIGLALANQLAVFNLTSAEFEFVKQGLNDAMTGKTPVTTSEDYNKKIQDLASERRSARGAKLAADAKEFIGKAEKEKGAVKTKSGLIYIPLKEGSGQSPAMTDTLTANYRGTLIDGKEFDSSFKRNKPAEISLMNVIKCWSEGVQMMKVGGKARLVCPPDLAYGEKGAGGTIPPNATLVFEVELLEIKKDQPPPAPGHGMGHGM